MLPAVTGVPVGVMVATRSATSVVAGATLVVWAAVLLVTTASFTEEVTVARALSRPLVAVGIVNETVLTALPPAGRLTALKVTVPTWVVRLYA